MLNFPPQFPFIRSKCTLSYTSYPKFYSHLSIGLPTKEAKEAFGKLSPAKPIFMQPVPGSHIIVGLSIFTLRQQDIMQSGEEENIEEQPPQQPPTQTDPLTKLHSCLNLTRCMPPSKLRKNLIGLINLAPQIQDNLLEKIDLPMEIDTSDPTQPFLKTQFNRDGDSYRSPFTNQFIPACQNGYKPSGLIRNFEESAAFLFAEYAKLYYGHETVSNFYVLENEEGGKNFSCGFFAKKYCDEGEGFDGSWDSFNVVDVVNNGSSYLYKLTTTIMIEMNLSNSGINLTGYLRKCREKEQKVENEADPYPEHLVLIGEMIEDTQTGMRMHLEDIYIAKTKEVIFTTRYEQTVGMMQQRMNLAQDLKKVKFS